MDEPGNSKSGRAETTSAGYIQYGEPYSEKCSLCGGDAVVVNSHSAKSRINKTGVAFTQYRCTQCQRAWTEQF